MSARRVRWHELARRPVLDVDGKRIGHVVDVVAAPVDDRMTVRGLLVGRKAWWGRIVQSRWFNVGRQPIEIAWDDVVELGDEVRTGVRRDVARHRDGGPPTGTEP
jgi:sporulation protein YlmC with PRC-barrel domain